MHHVHCWSIWSWQVKKVLNQERDSMIIQKVARQSMSASRLLRFSHVLVWALFLGIVACKNEEDQNVEVIEASEALEYTYSAEQMHTALISVSSAAQAKIETVSNTDLDKNEVHIDLIMGQNFDAGKSLQKRLLEEVGHVAAIHVSNKTEFPVIKIDLLKMNGDENVKLDSHIHIIEIY